MHITGPMMRRIVEAWHGIRISKERAEDLARIEAAVAGVVSEKASRLTPQDQPTIFRRALQRQDDERV